MTKQNFKQFAPNNTHYFATSVADWRVDTDLNALLKFMQGERFSFNVFLVKAPKDAEYEIDFFEPQGVEKVYLGHWKVQE